MENLYYFKILQTCTGDTSESMFCPTPSIDIDKFNTTRRQRRSNWSNYNILKKHRMKREANITSQNIELDIDMRIAFILDGVPDFRNLTGTPLEEYSQLDVYHNPVFTGFGTSCNTLTFTPTWPVEDKYLEIKVNKKVLMKHGMFQVKHYVTVMFWVHTYLVRLEQYNTFKTI